MRFGADLFPCSCDDAGVELHRARFGIAFFCCPSAWSRELAKGAATPEIARNVGEAAKGTARVASNMPSFFSGATGFLGITLMAYCGSDLGHWIGLHGFEQWPIIGFALGLLLLNFAGTARLRERIKRLEDGAAAALREKPRTA